MVECPAHSPHVLLITGTPGIGKTTVIRRVANRIKAVARRGSYTEEIRERGERRGFRLVGFDGTSQVIAHVDLAECPHVGKYGVDLQALDAAAALLRPDPAARVYLVDEIGKMECLSPSFVAAIHALLAGSTPIVVTVSARGGGLIAEVKGRLDCELWQVTRANRDGLPDRVLTWLSIQA